MAARNGEWRPRMMSFTADDARRRFGKVLKLADDGPVEITRHGERQRFIVMSRQVFDAFCLILHAHGEQRVLVTTTSALGKLLKDADDEEAFKRLKIGSAMMQRFLLATGEKL
jgi:prevent-host-death family protein